FNSTHKTTEVLDGDGWLKTGDLGEITGLGLKVLGRRDRVFKLANGRKINPAEMENDIKSRCPWVHQVYVFGSGKHFCRGLVFIEAPHDRGRFQELAEKTAEALLTFNGGLENKSKRLESILLLKQALSLEKGEVTPSFKIRPKILEENYRGVIEML